jgi:hypothetical protein
MNINASFLKTYADKTYKHTAMVRHKGKVVALAIDDQRQIYYSVLNLDNSDEVKSPLDVHYWLENPKVIRFSNEIVQVGYGIVDPVKMPWVKKGSRTEAAAGTLRPEEIDPFLSTTARLTADAPFDALSDGKYIYIFRQSIHPDHEDMVYAQNSDGSPVLDAESNRVPLVKDTLLVDRFVLLGTELQPKREVRYKRSRNKYRPQSNKDSLGAQDMEKKPFYEPTQELDFVRNLQDGRFSVLLLPTQIADIQRWQIFSHNSQTGQIDSFNVERSADGLFNTKGTQFYTSPEPKYQKSVFERQEGICPFTGEDLIPIVSQSGSGESALRFNGVNQRIDCGNDASLNCRAMTVEAWIYVEEARGGQWQNLINRWNPDNQIGFYLSLYENGCRFLVGNSLQGLNHWIATPIPLKQWVHVAASYDGQGTIKVYRDGQLSYAYDAKVNAPIAYDDTHLFINAPADSWGHFKGKIDEVRLWERDRSQAEIELDLNHHLVGNEPGLVGYWRFDEGSGDVLHDITDNANHGTIIGNPQWVKSDIPVGDRIGINRTSFKLSGSLPEAAQTSIDNHQTAVSGSAIAFQDSNDMVKLNRAVELSQEWTIETWFKYPLAPSSEWNTLMRGTHADHQVIVRYGKHLGVYDHSGGFIDSGYDVTGLSPGWHHLTAVGQGGSTVFYVDGTQVATVNFQSTSDVCAIGNYQGGTQPFSTIDEVRIWSCARSETEIKADMNYRLEGNESGLMGYWQFDEGSGTTVHDKTENANHGTISGNPKWVKSEAPISDRPVEENDILKPGLSAILYHQQEKEITGYDQQEKPVKRNARVMLAVPTGDTEHPEADLYIGVLDFAVSREGKLTQVPDVINLPPIVAPSSAEQQNEVALSLPLLHTDPFGFTVSGGLLDFASTNDTPLLCDSATGKLGLYFRGVDDQFFAAYYDTNTSKAKYVLDAETGQVNFLARSAEPELDRIKITVSHGVNNHTCTVAIANSATGITETWQQVPREVKEFAAVINGTVIEQAITYDYDKNASSNPTGLDKRSVQCIVVVGTAQGYVKNGIATGNGSTSSCQWVAQAPGKALTFDGQDDYVYLQPPADWAGNQQTEAAESALAFDGQNDYVELPELNFNFSQGFTIEARVYYDSFPYWSRIIDFGNGAGQDNILLANDSTSSRLILRIYKDGYAGSIYVDAALQTGQWMHIAATIDRAGNAKLYKNGEQINSGSLRLPKTLKRTRNYIGKSNWDGNGYFDGKIDDVRFWSRVRTQPEIKAGMNRRLTGKEAGLSGYWCFEASGAKDYSGYGNDGRFKGSPKQVAAPPSLVSVARGENHETFPQLAQFDANSNLTLEAWVKPSGATGTTKIIHHHSKQSQYTLGIKPMEVKSALAFDGRQEYIEIPYQAALNPKDFTIELWAKVTGGTSYRSPFCSRGHEQGYEFFIEGGKWYFRMGAWVKKTGYRGYLPYEYEDNFWKTITGSASQNGVWTHLAGTYSQKSQQMRFYINGQLVGSIDQINISPNPQYPLRIGAGRTEGNGYDFFNGQIDDVRIWKRARSDKEIQADMNRQLSAQEIGLVGYWHFESGTKDYTSKGNNGKISGNPQNVASALKGSAAFYTVFAGVGEQFKQTQKPIPSNQWEHLAVVYDQSYALEFQGDDYLSCNSDTTLDISQDLTLEVFLKLDDFTQPRGVLTKGHLGDGTPESVTYSVYIDRDRKIAFAFEDKDGNPHIYKSSGVLRTGVFQKIAVTRQYQIQIPTAENPQVSQWTDIRFYIDHNEVGYHKYDGKDPGSNDLPLEMGKTYNSGEENYFKGIISEVRLWNKALPQENIGIRTQGNEDGLVSWWRLEEKQGNMAYDSKSNNHASLKGAQWVKNPDTTASTFIFYHNGLPVETHNLVSQPLWGEEQFTLGGSKNGSLQNCFAGTMEEVRIWKVARTQEQIQDNLFTRLKGEKEDLIANYTFDSNPDSAVDSNNASQLQDYSLLGNHLTLGSDNSQPTATVSTAPISDDIAQVRSALAGVETQFHDVIHSRPAVQEYGDMQYDADGNLTGIHKRCYGYIKNGQWHLLTGYKVGNLVTEWIGQVQGDPQIIGYIEGAPPVPSENLTGTSLTLSELEDYSESSWVEIEEAETVNYIYSSSKETGFDTSVETKAVLGFKSQSDAGFGMTTSVEETNIMAGVKGSVETSDSQLSEASVSYGRNTTRSSSMELVGAWENKDESGECYINKAVGRRYMPKNLGYALVQSDTMDVFALRLAHNNALVSYRMQPNPDIPKDWNIILFPINPTYTKQGTLDGKVGIKEDGSIQCDPDYPNAYTHSQYSYFKPTEAYSLKQQIEREQQELQTYYQNYSIDANLNTTSEEIPKSLAARNLVNTYVWTADGGFFSESTQVMESVQESTTGSYSFNGMSGATFELNTAYSKAAVGIEMDALFGGHLEVIKTKGKETEKSFSINVEVLGEEDIQLYVNTEAEKQKYPNRNEGGGAYDETGKPIKRPGKVDAYRFMTFYLEPTKDNFEDFFHKVVDPIWLEESNDPNAVALRQANQSDKKPKCWRVLHRVTFVSRVLPEIEAPNVPPMEKAIRTVNIDSNYELIKKLEPFVKNKTQDATIFADAVRNTLKAHLPELQPFEADIIEYAALYFGVSLG